MRNADRWHAIVSGEARGASATLARALLFAASVPYSAVIRVRNRLYDIGWFRVEKSPMPAISIGNLTLGGTGKTPCVEYVARYLNDAGHQVAILSRGYGQVDGPNDESLVLEQNLPEVPHLQGKHRSELARIAVEELESDVLVLDDSFQHRRFARALDLVLIDATNPWGNGYIFPRGTLREPLTSLRRASAAIITRVDLVDPVHLESIRRRIAVIAPSLPIMEAVHAPLEFINSNGETRPATMFANASAFAFCGIGNPAAFRKSLGQLLIETQSWREFPDHHPYSRQDVEELELWSESLPTGGFVLTTQKDLVKLRLPALGGRPLWALRVGFDVRDGGDRLRAMLDEATK